MIFWNNCYYQYCILRYIYNLDFCNCQFEEKNYIEIMMCIFWNISYIKVNWKMFIKFKFGECRVYRFIIIVKK